MANENVGIVIGQVIVVPKHDWKWTDKEGHKVVIEIDPLITGGQPQFYVVGDFGLKQTANAVVRAIVEDALIVPGENRVALDTHADRWSGQIDSRSGNDLGVSIQIIEIVYRGNVIVMIVNERHYYLVQVPKHGHARCVLEPAIINHVAQRCFLYRILLQRHAVMEVDTKIANENIERDLRFRRDENAVGVGVRMIDIKSVAETDVEPQRV